MQTNTKYQIKVENSTNSMPASACTQSQSNLSVYSLSSPRLCKETAVPSKAQFLQSQNESVLSRADTHDDECSDIRSLVDFFEHATDVDVQVSSKRPAPLQRLVFFAKLEDGSLAASRHFMDLNTADCDLIDESEPSMYSLSEDMCSGRIH